MFLCELHCGLLSLALTLCFFPKVLLYVNDKLKTLMFDKGIDDIPSVCCSLFFPVKKINNSHLFEDERMRYEYDRKFAKIFFLLLQFLLLYNKLETLYKCHLRIDKDTNTWRQSSCYNIILLCSTSTESRYCGLNGM